MSILCFILWIPFAGTFSFENKPPGLYNSANRTVIYSPVILLKIQRGGMLIGMGISFIAMSIIAAIMGAVVMALAGMVL